MRRAYLELHLAVFLFGFTAILWKVISISATSLVWWRVLIACLGMLVPVRISRTLREVLLKRILQYLGIGVIVAVHWITFFGAIKASNASVALIAMATTSFFTALVEPVLMKRRVDMREILLGLLIIPAMALIVHGIDSGMYFGLVLGLISAILASIFASLNKLLIDHARPMQIAFFEMSGVWIFISLLLIVSGIVAPSVAEFALAWPVGMDWVYLVILALACTTFAYVLSVRALHHLSAFASNLVVNLEPVYGIALAWVLLKENHELSPGFYIGVSLIIVVVFCYPFIRKGRRRPEQRPPPL
jgi:drug/metabolite transporter (DMT)-like permease